MSALDVSIENADSVKGKSLEATEMYDGKQEKQYDDKYNMSIAAVYSDLYRGRALEIKRKRKDTETENFHLLKIFSCNFFSLIFF